MHDHHGADDAKEHAKGRGNGAKAASHDAAHRKAHKVQTCAGGEIRFWAILAAHEEHFAVRKTLLNIFHHSKSRENVAASAARGYDYFFHRTTLLSVRNLRVNRRT